MSAKLNLRKERIDKRFVFVIDAIVSYKCMMLKIIYKKLSLSKIIYDKKKILCVCVCLKYLLSSILTYKT